MTQERVGILSDDSQFICPNCKILMKYKYAGKYVCEKCGAEELNDFGKVKKYLDENGPTNAIELSAKTGVRRSKIGEYLRLGKAAPGDIPAGRTKSRRKAPVRPASAVFPDRR